METIFVKIHPAVPENKIAIVDASQEQSKLWEGGLSLVKTPATEQQVFEVVDTVGVAEALNTKRLVKADKPVAKK